MPTNKRDDPGSSGDGDAGSASTPPSSRSPTSSSTEASPPDVFRAFMVALATDPAKLGEFIKDSDAAMKRAGITEVDQLILKSGHPATIHARLMGQRFSMGSPGTTAPVTVLVVDMTRQSGSPQSAASDQPTVRSQPSVTGFLSPGSSIMFPNSPLQVVPPQYWPQVHPQVVVHPQVHPQLVLYPQAWPQIFPQVHPQLVLHPQIFPQIHPQMVIHPQIFPQVHPQLVIHPQIWPQVHPQLVLYPQVFPQVFPQVYPQVFPQVQPQFISPPQGS